VYGKLFASMFDGTLGTRGPWQALVTFQQMVILADKDGLVDMTPEALSRRTTIPLEIITKGLEMLELPDPDSRSPDEEGRRIVRLSDTRSWGWRVVNYDRYREIRTADERRAYHRQYQRTRRARTAVNTVNRVSTKSTNSSKQYAVSSTQEASKSNPLSGDKPPDDARKGQSATAKKRQQARASAARAIDYLNAKAGTKFRAVEANLKLPAARILQDGALEADLLAVVDLKLSEAERGEFGRQYLRPATLWNGEKFAQYLGQVGARAPGTKGNGQPVPTKAEAYFEMQDGKLVAMAEYPIGPHLEVARTCAREYASRIARGTVRNVMVKIGAEARRFTVKELEQ
jgi:uncharacterized phage protein (TIGR02220 family)